MKSVRVVLAAMVLGMVLPVVLADGDASGPVIMDMDTVRHKPAETDLVKGGKGPCGTVELVDGKFGKACKFSFVETKSTQFMTASVKATPEWDKAEGFSFWVKGDGSDHFGGIELMDSRDFKFRYGYCFSLKSTDWTKITVPWRDVIPELSGKLVDPAGAYKPSNIGEFWFGKFYYWPTRPEISYSIDQISLEKKVDVDKTDYTPKDAPLARLMGKLKNKEPITIVLMGDSLTDKKHWSNRSSDIWAEMLAKKIKERYGSEVKLVNVALGGTALNQNLVLMPTWLKDTPQPDLVTVMFGYNDYDNGVRGERYKEYLDLAVDRIRRMTKGSADVLLMTTCPAHARWQTMKEMSQAARDVAKARKAGLADPEAEFYKAVTADEAKKEGYWVNKNGDLTHLGARGQKAICDSVMTALEEK